MDVGYLVCSWLSVCKFVAERAGRCIGAKDWQGHGAFIPLRPLALRCVIRALKAAARALDSQRLFQVTDSFVRSCISLPTAILKVAHSGPHLPLHTGVHCGAPVD